MSKENFTAFPKVEINATFKKTIKKIYLIFDVYDNQKKYVDKEYKFCKHEYIKYQSAFTGVSREYTKQALEDKRLLFATKYGFKPSKSNSRYWIYHPGKIKLKRV